MSPADHRAKRVALGLDIWQMGLPLDVTRRLLDWENGAQMAMDEEALEQNLWDRFLETVKHRMEAKQAPYDMFLQPWSLSEVQLAAKQLQYGAGQPRYEARPRGVVPPGYPIVSAPRRGNSRRF